MATTAHPGERLHERISRWQQGDTEGVLADEALIEAAQLWWKAALGSDDDGVDQCLRLLGWLHWARSESGSRGKLKQLEQFISLQFFQLLWQRSPQTVPVFLRRHFDDAEPDLIADREAHASGIMRDIASIVVTERRDTGIRLYELSQWPPGLPPEYSAPPLVIVAQALAGRHQDSGDLADLDAAVRYGEQAVTMAPHRDELRADVLQDVSVILCARFEVTAAKSDSDRIIGMLDEALDIARSLRLHPVVLLSNRSLARLRRFMAFHSLDDLRLAKADGDDALAVLAPGSPRRVRLEAHVEQLTQMLAALPADADEKADDDGPREPAALWAAIEEDRTEIMTAWWRPGAAEPDIGLLPLLSLRAQRNLRHRIRGARTTGEVTFVLSAEAMTDAAYVWWLAQRLAARDPDSPSVPQAREILGEFHIQRHNATVQSRRPDELVQTLMHWLAAPAAVRDSLPDPLDKLMGPVADPEIQTRYAATLLHFAGQEDNPALVKAAILLLTAAVEATDGSDPQLPERLGRLSDAYLTRGQDDDTDIGAALAADAVAVIPADHPNAGKLRDQLRRARSRQLRHGGRRITPSPVEQTLFVMSQEYLGTAKGTEMAAEMDAFMENYSATRPTSESASASRRFLREYQRDGLAVSLELALRAAEDEAPLEGASDSEKLSHLLHLGEIYHERQRLTSAAADLAEVVRLLWEAHAIAPRIGPTRTSIVNGLATAYSEQWRTEGRGPDDARLEELCLAARSTHTDALPNVRARQGVGRLCLRLTRYNLAVSCYREAISMLRYMVLEEIDRDDQTARLAQFADISSEAVTAHLLAGDAAGALEVAEEARGVLLGLNLDLRADLGELRATRPDLAERFERRRESITVEQSDQARTPGGYVRYARGTHSRDAWAHLLRDIREVPGYEDFLRPARAGELSNFRLPGPLVLINVSEFGAHALIVGPTPGIRAVALEGLTADDVQKHGFDLLTSREVLPSTLSWLWETIVAPVVEATGRAARVWWVPTGLISVFPLHAAVGPDGECALDLIDSRYVPTIRLLARGLVHDSAPQPGGDLIVAVRLTAAGAELPGAEAEGRALLDRLPDAKALFNEDATRENVLAALPNATRVSFACHTVRDDRRPHRSGLSLFDDLLTVEDLSRLDLPHAEFAQLCACATAMPTPDAPDELTHLAAAFQTAGFRNVVATLWPVRDLIAAEFSQLVNDTGSVTAAARVLREQYPDRPEHWAGFLHYGV